MMTVDINWADVVGAKTLADGGHMGDLLKVAREHVDDAVTNNRLTQDQAGQIYTSMIPACINGAIQFVLDEQVKEAQAMDTAASIALKEDQLALERNKAEAELEKQWGYDVTRDAVTDALVLGATTGTGKIDEEVALIVDQDSELLANGLTDRSVKERGAIEAELTGSSKRHSIDIEAKVLEQKIVGRIQSEINAE